MQLPTKLVRLQDGSEVVINLSDFDPAIHGEPGSAQAPADSGAPLDSTPGPIATVPTAQAVELISAATTIEQLDGLEADEKASQKHPGGRKGVLAAIAERRAELVE